MDERQADDPTTPSPPPDGGSHDPASGAIACPGGFRISSVRRRNPKGAVYCLAEGCTKNAQANTTIELDGYYSSRYNASFCTAHYNDWLIGSGRVESWECKCGRKVMADIDRCGKCHNWRDGSKARKNGFDVRRKSGRSTMHKRESKSRRKKKEESLFKDLYDLHDKLDASTDQINREIANISSGIRHFGRDGPGLGRKIDVPTDAAKDYNQKMNGRGSTPGKTSPNNNIDDFLRGRGCLGPSEGASEFDDSGYIRGTSLLDVDSFIQSSQRSNARKEEAVGIMSQFSASVKSYVVSQFGSRLDGVLATAPFTRDELLEECTEDFPFLADVDWDAERKARMGRCQRIVDARTEAGADAVRDQYKRLSEAALASTERALGAKQYNNKNSDDDIDDDDVDFGNVDGGEDVDLDNDDAHEMNAGVDLDVEAEAEIPPALAAARATKRAVESAQSASSLAKAKRKRAAQGVIWPNLRRAQSDSDESYVPPPSNDGLFEHVPLPPAKKKTKSVWRASIPGKKYSFEERVSQLTLYKEDHGHLNVKSDEDKGLSAFFNNVRYARKKMGRPNPWIKLTDERIASLDAIGFDWAGKTRKSRANKSFEDRLEQCKAYAGGHGHLRIPSDYRANDDGLNDYECLGLWAQTMRQNYHDYLEGRFDGSRGRGPKDGKQTVGYKLEALEEVGFDFELGEAGAEERSDGAAKRLGRIWDSRIEQCRQFEAENGHMDVPNGHKALGIFATRMRKLYGLRFEGTSGKKSSEQQQLTDVEREKVQHLESIGFAFDRKFDVNLRRLVAFKAEKGHCKVPLEYKADTVLAHWAYNIRKEYNRMNKGEGSKYLTADRMRKLATVGFAFGTHKETPWEENFQKLKAYREEHGKDPLSSHPELGNWLTRQRVHYGYRQDGNDALPMLADTWDKREEKLRSIGFALRVGPRPSAESRAKQRAMTKKTFDDWLAEFVAWKEQHGHPFVPTATGGNLGRWVAKQRMAYRAYKGEKKKTNNYGILTAEKALKLANAGFAFDASDIRRTPKDAAAEVNEEEQGDELQNHDAEADSGHYHGEGDGTTEVEWGAY